MKNNSTRKRTMAFFMMLVMLVTTFLPFADHVHAEGVGVGSSGTIRATGAKHNMGGGIQDMKSMVFRVGLSRDSGFKYDPDSGFADTEGTLESFSRRYPNNTGMSVYFLGGEYESIGTNYVIGSYVASTRELYEYNDPLNKSRVIKLNTVDVPLADARNAAKAKTLLQDYSFTGNKTPKTYAELANGKWKSVVGANITTADANKVWSYILGRNVNDEYNIVMRTNYLVSQYADDAPETLTESKKEDIARGYLSLLITTWKIIPTEMRHTWETAIEDYIKMQGWDGSAPQTIVVDTATVLYVGPTQKRIVLSTADYFMYYGAINQANHMHNALNFPASTAGDTYKMMQKILEFAIRDDGGKDVQRTSDATDRENAFYHGASAIAYPLHRLVSENNISEWKNRSSTVYGLFDALPVGNTPNGKLRGFNSLGYFPMIENEEPVEDTAPSIKLMAKPKDVIIPPTQELIGEVGELTLTHDSTDVAEVNRWLKIFQNLETGTPVNFHVTWERTLETNPAGGDSSNSMKPDKGHVSGFTFSQRNARDWITGAISIKVLDLALLNEPLQEGQKKTYTYTPTLKITYRSKGATTDTVVTVKGNSDYVSFQRGINPDNLISYVSHPSSYAELKEGSPDNETFEAMSGVPSGPNKRLYLGVGGSEFIVDVQLEYKENVESVWRTYRAFYRGVASEFKDPDNAKTKSLGGHTVDLHNGGTYTKEWTGTIKNDGKDVTVKGSGNVTATSVAVPNREEYDTKKAEAEKYVADVNKTILSHTAGSDKITRSHKGWGASITIDAPVDPQNVTRNNSCFKPETSGDPPVTVQVPQPCEVTAPKGADGSFRIKVEFTVPAHVICGPECTNDMPGIEDNWKQRVVFDYMKITKAEVYELRAGRITQVDNIFGSGNSTLSATIKQGDQNIFYNIAQQNAGGNDVNAQSSYHGRLRYSLDQDQHDTVVYDLGTRTNKSDGQGKNGVSVSPDSGGTKAVQGGGHNNSWATGILYNNTTQTTDKDYHTSKGGSKTGYSSTADTKDVATTEWKKFDELRKQENIVTVVSDMLILQTSSGDQSVIYFEKDSTPKQAQEQFDPVKATKEEMWDNNPYSAAKWSPDEINVGSYNGQYGMTGDNSSNNRKYWGYNQRTNMFYPSRLANVPTAFDSNGAGVDFGRKRPARSSKLYIWGDQLINQTIPNGAYPTGNAEVFYARLLTYKSGNPSTPLGAFFYNSQTQPNFGSLQGIVKDGLYSDNHNKVNDIVIHTPVSTEDAVVVSLNPERDQRTAPPPGGAAELLDKQNELKICPLDPALCEFRVLNCEHRLDKELVSIDFEDISATQVYNKTTGAYIPYQASSGFSYSPRAGFGDGNVMNAFGTRWSLNFSDIGLTNDKNTTVLVEMDFWMPTAPTGSGNMIVSFQQYDFWLPSTLNGTGTWNTGNGTERRLDGFNFTNKKVRLGLQFSFGHMDDNKVFIDGVEQTTYTRVNESPRPEGKIGTQLNIGSYGHNGSYPANFYVDNLKIVRKGGTFEHTEACYIETVTHDTQWVHEHSPSCYAADGVTLVCNNAPLTKLSSNNTHVHTADCVHVNLLGLINSSTTSESPTTFEYKGSYETYTAPFTGTYRLEVWGAQGGNGYNNTAGGQGGYSKGEIKLTKGETIYVYVGGKGGDFYDGVGGWNGGGTASGGGQSGAGGGGGTDIRRGGTTLNHRIIVAGGGGGGSDGGTPGHGGGTKGGNGDNTTGGSQTERGTGSNDGGYFGAGGSAYRHGGGGGGGYWGGGGGYDCGNTGAGGSGYVGTLQNSSMTVGGRTGNGKAVITPLESEAVGVRGYDWKDVFGSNWKNYVTTTTIGGEGYGSKTFLNTGTGQYGGTTNNSTGNLGGSIRFNSGQYIWTVPETGIYTIEAFGAQGGEGTNHNATGGLGAKIKGDFNLIKGEEIIILVGHQPTGGYTNGGGGGGGTYVAKGSSNSSATALIVAAGGGGTSTSGNGGDGRATTGNGSGGSAGTGSYPGGGGGGFDSNGGSGNGTGGSSFKNFGTGGKAHSSATQGWGGFGGGGGNGWYGGGGGGGYQGGKGGNTDGVGGDGGYSYNNGMNQSNISGVQTGHGKVVITGKSEPRETTTVNIEKVKQDVAKGIFPDKMPDGSPNPIFKCIPYIGKSNESPTGLYDGYTHQTGVSFVDVTHPRTGKTIKALKLAKGTNVPVISSKKFTLAPNTYYNMSFEYWTDGGSTEFNVDLFPDTLPQTHPVATTSVKKFEWRVKSSSNDMSNANIRIFNDREKPNPSNIYITNIRFWGDSQYNTHVHNDNCVTTKVLDCSEPHHSSTLTSYDLSDINIWDVRLRSSGASFGWDEAEQAWKAVGHVEVYLKKDYAIPIDRNRSYQMSVDVKRTSDEGKTFYWGGDRLNSAKAHLAGYGGTYDYTAASSVRVPVNTWTTYSYSGKTGTAANASGWGTDTAYYAVGGLLNYSGTNTQVTYIKNIKFSEVGGRELMPRPHVDESTVMHYDGSNTICWDACGIDDNHKHSPEVEVPDGGGTIINATFINMDYPFQVYFPNIGDFAQIPAMKGIPTITTTRGKGYIDNMNTTEFTAKKRVKFEFNVIYDGELYRAGSWINLPVNQSFYDFYTVLANSEAVSARIEYEAVPINGRPVEAPQNDNHVSTTNRDRFADYSAYHGAYKQSYIDVVGRIGNFVVMDTEDFRFSNLFKQEKSTGEWLVEGLVREVDSFRQNRFYADKEDIRGVRVENTGTWLNTYGTQTWLEKEPLPFPVNPSDNSEPALKEQFLKVGYDVLADITTIGEYQDGVIRALPYYFRLDLDSGDVLPLDVYVKNGDEYRAVNKYRAADSGSIPQDIYPYSISIDWTNESLRRNYSMDESAITNRMAEVHGEYVYGLVNDEGTMVNGVTGVRRLPIPGGNFIDIGSSQRIVADKKARTFVGTSSTYGDEKDPLGRIDVDEWSYAAQRWHLKFGLPSSAVFVEAGLSPTQENIDAVKSGNGVILLTTDIISIGRVFTLRWQQPGISSFTVTKNGKTEAYNLASHALPPVIALYDLTQTAIIDITVQGSH